MNSENENTKLGIIYILGETLGKRADLSEDLSEEVVSNLLSLLQEPSQKIKSKAAEALGKLQKLPPKAMQEKIVQALFVLLGSKESIAIRAAINALYELKWTDLPEQVVQELVGLLAPTFGDKTVVKLLGMQLKLSEKIILDLNNLSHNKDEMIRSAAAKALHMYKHKKESPVLPTQAV